jgi:hypothetical protein
MNTTEQINQMLKQTMEADKALQSANDTADSIINTNSIDYHESSALSNNLFKAELAINELILYLKSLSEKEA